MTHQSSFNGQVTDVPEPVGLAARSTDLASASPDPFDPKNLRLPTDFSAGTAVRKALTKVPCRKPNRHEFVRTRPGVGWRVETAVFEDKLNRGELYMIDQSLWVDMAGDIHAVALYLAANRQGDVFLWPCKLPGTDGRTNDWNDTLLTAARLASEKWVRVASNQRAGYYDVFEATGSLSEPEWPELPMRELLKLCFGNRFIQGPDHPILRALRGEA